MAGKRVDQRKQTGKMKAIMCWEIAFFQFKISFQLKTAFSLNWTFLDHLIASINPRIKPVLGAQWSYMQIADFNLIKYLQRQ